jgi:hypothetical protein
MDGSPLASIPLGQIRFSADAWPRAFLDSERVDDFTALYLEQGPAALPAPELVPDGSGGYLIGDGVHRIEAAGDAGLQAIPSRLLAVPVGVSPVEFAYLHALGRSAISSKPLSRAEKQEAIRRLLQLRPEDSDRAIALLVGVDHKTVGRIRRGDSPTTRRSDDWAPGPTPEAVAKRLFSAFEKAYEARGLGIADFFAGDRTGERLARVLVDVYGDKALKKAEQFCEWLDRAVQALENAPSDGA